MTNTLKVGKRILAVGTIVATLLSTMGIALLPLSAKAADLQAGSLIKASMPTVYYYGGDGKRYVFPNEKTFNTWYSDFSGVVTITDAELAGIAIGGNVVYRAGTQLVKITTDPKVYAVEPGGVLRWVQTEEIAKGLYGNDWASRVQDVPDAYFTNYSIGSPITDIIPPLGSVVSDGSSKYYINKSGQLQSIDEARMTANGFRSEYVLALGSAALAGFSGGDAIAGALSELSDAAQIGEASGPAFSGDVVVTKSDKTPGIGMSIPSGAYYAPLLCLDVTNNSNQEVKIEGVTARRLGILADSNVSGVLITDGIGVLHGSNVTFGESVANSNFGSEPMYVGAGTKEVVCVNVNIATAVNTGTIGARMDAAADLLIKTGSGQLIVPKGQFPITGPIQSIVTGAGALGSLQVSSRAVAGGTLGGNETQVDQGVKDLDVAKFRLQEITGNEDVELTNINIQNNGSASEGDFENVRLLDQNNNVIAVTDRMNNNEVKFTINLSGISGLTAADVGPHGGLVIKAGQLKEFTVRIDTSTNTNSANRTVIFSIQEVNDIRALGLETLVGVTVVELGGAPRDIFPIGDGYNVVQFRAGTISWSRATASLAGKIARGQTNVELASFDINAFGEDVELQAVQYVIVQDGAGTGLQVGNYALTGTVKIQNASGANIYSQTSTDANNYGTNGLTVVNNQIATANANGTASLKTLNTFYVIKAGEIGQIKFVGDIHQNSSSADSYTVIVTGYRIRRLSSNNYVTVNNINIAGNQLTVDASTLLVTANSAFNPVNLVLGGSSQKIGSFNLQAGSAEGQRINAIKIQVCSDTVAAIGTIAANDCAATTAGQLAAVSTVTLMADGQAIAPSFNISTVNGFTASVDNFSVPQNETKAVDVYAVVSTAWPAATGIGVSLEVTSAVGGQSQATSQIPAEYSTRINALGGGVLNVAAISDGTVNIPKLLHSSESDVEIYKFQILETQNAEDITLDKLYLGVRNGLNNLTNFKLFLLGSPSVQVGNSAPINNGEVRFTGLNHVMNKGGVKTFVIKASTVPAGTMNLAANNMIAGITYLEYTGQVSGAQTIQSGGVSTAGALASSILTTSADPDAGGAIVWFDAATDQIGVANLAALTANQSIRIDWNNDGDLLDDDSATSGVSEGAVYYVCNKDATGAVAPAGRIKLGTNAACTATVNILAVGAGVVGGRIIGGNTAIVPVNDITNFELGDPIQVDWNNDGDFADNLDGFNEAGTYFVCNINAIASAISLGLDINCNNRYPVPFVANFAAGGRISSFPLSSEVSLVEETEPVLAVHASYRDLSQSSNAQVATFVFASNGPRPITLDHLTLEVSGSYETNSAQGIFGPRNFELWRGSSVDGGKTIQITTGAAQLAYTPSGLNRGAGAAIDAGVATTTTAAAVALNATSMSVVFGAGRTINVGDRITFRTAATTCDTAEINANSVMGYRVTQVAGTSITFTPGLRGNAGLPAALNVICPLFGTEKAIVAVASTTSVTAATGGFAVGDIITFAENAAVTIYRNGGDGYRITAITTGAPNDTIIFTPALPIGNTLAAADIIRGDGNALGTNDVVESGGRVRFDLPAGEQIGANSSAIYAIVADTSSIKNAASSGTSTLTMRVAGSRGLESNANGFVWSYTSANGVARSQVTVTDSYPVNSFTNIY